MDNSDLKNLNPPPSVYVASHPHTGSPSIVTQLPISNSDNHNVGGNLGSSDKGVSMYRSRFNSHPKPFIVLAGLILLLVVTIVGLVLYMVLVPNAYDGAMAIVNALFILLVVAIFALMFRQAMILHQLFHPPSSPPPLSKGYPTWLTSLPSYRDVIRGRSSDQDRWTGELPVYGENRGTELLAKTSRTGGGAANQDTNERARNRESITERFA